ncbi:MAG: HAMP domain-containing sensor histidine kinase [Acidimicrobiia bacterium]|nr:HAMP domain-containing sensor histidine kinase [Acidimicrobiia bacterium]
MGTASRHDPGTEILHRAAIQIGALAAVLTFGVYVTWALVSGDLVHLASAVGPAALGLVCAAMLLKRWYHAEIVLALAAVSTVLSFKLWGSESDSSPAAIGIVAIVSIGALFMPTRWKWHYVWLATVGLFATGVFWEGFTTDAIWIGVAAALSGVVAMVLFIKMRDNAVALDRRYRILVENVPMPLLEQDWTPVRQWIEQRRNAGITDIAAYLDEHPDELDKLVHGITVRRVNPAITNLIGPVKSRDAQFDDGINHDHLLPFVRTEIIHLWNGDSPRPGDYRLVRTTGEPIWARLQAVDVEPGLIEGVDRIIVATDVTKLRETQAELADQIRSKDEFIAAVSHELRTPLTSVLGFADLINQDRTMLPPDKREMLAHLVDEANDMAHIVEDLLVAARAEIGSIAIDLEQLNLAALAHKAIGDLDESFAVHRREEPMVMADRVRVGQIVRNLASNALRYGGEDRSVRIGIDGCNAVVEVRDDGKEIPPEERERIFEPYARAHNRPGMAASVGLGLSVSRQLAKLMGGDVVYLRENGYSVFRLTLPLAAIPVRS